MDDKELDQLSGEEFKGPTDLGIEITDEDEEVLDKIWASIARENEISKKTKLDEKKAMLAQMQQPEQVPGGTPPTQPV